MLPQIFYKKLLIGILVAIYQTTFAIPLFAQNEIIIKDFRGVEVSIPNDLKRVVALTPALAEMVFQLTNGQALVGHPEHSDISSSKSKVLGPYTRISAELVFDLKPDLVLASIDGNDPALIRNLEQSRVKVFVFDTRSLNKLVQSYELIEKIFDKKSTKLTANLLQQLDLIKTLGNNTAIKNKSVFVQIGWNPLVTVSKSTLIGEVIESSGLVNLYGNSAVPYPKPSQEDVVSKNPDYILIFPMTSSKAEHEDSKKIWLDFTNLSAVRSKKLHIFPVGTLTKPGFDFYQGLITFYKVLNK